MKVLVIQQRRGIGDCVLFLSFIHSIAKKEKVSVTLLVNETTRAKEYLAQDKYINQILFLNKNGDKTGKHSGIKGFFNLANKLKQYKFDKVYIFNSSLRYALLAKFSSIPMRHQYPLFKKKGQNVIETAKSFVEKNTNTTISTEPEIFINDKEIEETKKKYNITHENKHLCIGLSASGPTKRWDIKKFIILLERLDKEHNCVFYLAGGKNDKSLIEEVLKSTIGRKCISFADLTIKQTLPIIKNCSLYCGNDTSWLHLSCALGLKCVALFMDSPVLAYGKYSDKISIVVPERETEETTTHNTRGKDRISVDQVFLKTTELLN